MNINKHLGDVDWPILEKYFAFEFSKQAEFARGQAEMSRPQFFWRTDKAVSPPQTRWHMQNRS